MKKLNLILITCVFLTNILMSQTQWINYTTLNTGLPDNDVFSIAIDGSGTKWIATWGAGITSFDGSTWTVYNTANSGLPDNYVNSIAIDESETKWIGTRGVA